jgi:hypothetical protein
MAGMKHDLRTRKKFHKSELSKTCGRCCYVADPHELARVDGRPPLCPNCEKLLRKFSDPIQRSLKLAVHLDEKREFRTLEFAFSVRLIYIR